MPSMFLLHEPLSLPYMNERNRVIDTDSRVGQSNTASRCEDSSFLQFPAVPPSFSPPSNLPSPPLCPHAPSGIPSPRRTTAAASYSATQLSTTRLADKTLTETPKGQGFSLPWQVSDGTSPFGDNLSFNYPMRDLLKKELVAFTKLTSPRLADIVLPVNTKSALSTSSKTTTIDDLMTQYFESVDITRTLWRMSF
ncbi:hypothetical protein GMDG_07183 [Pseudogymnoascus destructans 20631-21]|uniref:Uncharacterized protein n=1 Tax=Pseudogymnoascus destructans (strain ATCC MYA-4855 / 20631-21) TaxID=658429 RepID=L8FZL0_PSED2|nr:hypothetical protein GMDG_07183 [Pseudogymnoascus destructans 20631-21]